MTVETVLYNENANVCCYYPLFPHHYKKNTARSLAVNAPNCSTLSIPAWKKIDKSRPVNQGMNLFCSFLSLCVCAPPVMHETNRPNSLFLVDLFP